MSKKKVDVPRTLIERDEAIQKSMEYLMKEQLLTKAGPIILYPEPRWLLNVCNVPFISAREGLQLGVNGSRICVTKLEGQNRVGLWNIKMKLGIKKWRER